MQKRIQQALTQPALGLIFVGVLLITAFAVPQIRAMAVDLLSLFRVEQIEIVEINPANLPDQFGSSPVFEQLLTQDFQIEKQGKTQQVSSASEASGVAGWQVRLPTESITEGNLVVEPGSRISFQVDVEKIQLLLGEINRSDISIPAGLDGALIGMDVYPSVVARYGDCQFETGVDRQRPYASKRIGDCILLVQTPSPTITAPPKVDLAQLGRAYLQIMGLSDQEATQISETIDWTSTLVIPIPQYGASYREINVDGVKGTLIKQSIESHAPQYMLLWVRDDVLYTITGAGDPGDALGLVENLGD